MKRRNTAGKASVKLAVDPTDPESPTRRICSEELPSRTVLELLVRLVDRISGIQMSRSPNTLTSYCTYCTVGDLTLLGVSTCIVRVMVGILT